MKKILLHNFAQKILAVLLAFFIWLFATVPTMHEKSVVQFFVPITYQNLPKDLEIVSPQLQSVNVSVEAMKSNLQDVHPSHFQVFLNLSGATEGKNSVAMSEKNIKSPNKDIKVISVSPTEVQLELEKIAEKLLPIRPVIQGKLAPGFVVNDIVMEPNNINIRGPFSVMETMDQIETKAINVDGLNSDIDIAVTLDLPNRVRVLDNVNFLAARIKVGSEPMNLRIDKIPIGLINQTYVTRINPQEFNVLLRGPKSVLKNFSRDDLRAVVDLSQYKPGTYKIKEPKLYHPPSIQVLKVWPPIDIWVLKQKVYE